MPNDLDLKFQPNSQSVFNAESEDGLLRISSCMYGVKKL